MIRFKLKEMLARKEFTEARRITLNEVADATEIHRVTLSKIANERGYNAGVENVDRLCRFFDCQPGDLMEYVAEAKPPAKSSVKTGRSVVPQTSQKRPKTVPRN